ncbi:hypothetical protein SAMN02746066_03240 [Anaerosporobacter mobilis DSM 15930]|jgi:hypothetical protein|uniref:Uncharacterized protein n=1 Tax=Anaerosporobacter mobilis DSM 15930 TaxID=1120996 RepID=A0A1M7LFM1_9FIRM|nr:hypothetical protein [Anaerosporobacter mobilis]SHM76934.1 hypothetical protein SAMN02746066_03240 [Anaerosporobacter mobilis DSM 15930]
MNKNEDKLVRLFPKYFELFQLPDGAKDEEIKVFRACKTWKCDRESFTPSFEEMGCDIKLCKDPTDPGEYSLSTYEKSKDIKRFVNLNSNYGKPYKIAVGITKKECGKVQRTKERIKKKNSHVDWWLYEDAKPCENFKMIEDFQAFLEEERANRGV